MVSWEAVCLPMELGGLGIKRAREFNIAILCKWLWHVREDRWWEKLIRTKYGVQDGGLIPTFISRYV